MAPSEHPNTVYKRMFTHLWSQFHTAAQLLQTQLLYQREMGSLMHQISRF